MEMLKPLFKPWLWLKISGHWQWRFSGRYKWDLLKANSGQVKLDCQKTNVCPEKTSWHGTWHSANNTKGLPA